MDDGSHYKVGDFVSVEADGQRGRISDVTQPVGTFKMYTVQLFDGGFVRVGKHQLVKGELSPRRAQADDTSADQGELILDCIAQEELSLLMEDITATSSQAPAVTALGSTLETENPRDQFNRFAKPVEIDSFISANENQETKRKTLSHQRLLETYLRSVNEPRLIHLIPPGELCNHLCQFFISVRQKNGQEYEPVSLRSMMSSFERYLKRHNYESSVVAGHEFTKMREVLKCKQKDLKSKGFGNRPNASDEVSVEEIDLLYEREQLGLSSPESLLNTLWLNNTLIFGMRAGSAEHRVLCWGDVELRYDNDTECEYLAYVNERQTKTRTGEDVKNIRLVKPKMFATYDNRCPVAMYKRFASKRPEAMNTPDSPFYLAVITHNKRPSLADQWFLAQPVGVNKLRTLMKKMAEKANLPNLSHKKLTNTSVRKHTCQVLVDNDVQDTHAIHVTGHKNPQSLDNYRTISNRQQQRMSNMLVGKSGAGKENIRPPARPATPEPEAASSVDIPRQHARSDTPEPEAASSVDIPRQHARSDTPEPEAASSVDIPRQHARSDTPEPEAASSVDIPRQHARSDTPEAVSISLTQSQSHHRSVTVDNTLGLQSLFQNSNIYGGTFNISVHVPEAEGHQSKRPRLE